MVTPPVLHERAEGRGVALELVADADSGWFDGHFPGRPLLPGLAQIAWAAELAQRRFAVARPFRQLAGIKFQRVIEPGQRLTLELDYDADAGELRFRYADAGGTLSSGRLRCGNE